MGGSRVGSIALGQGEKIIGTCDGRRRRIGRAKVGQVDLCAHLHVTDVRGSRVFTQSGSAVFARTVKKKGQKVLHLPKGRTKSAHDAPAFLLGGRTRQNKMFTE